MNKQRGFTLIEFMIGITIGLLVLVAAEQMYFTSLRSNSDGVKLQRFEQTLQVLQGIMVSEIRRAGYIKPNASLTTQANGKYFNVSSDATCITFSHSTSDTDQVFYGYKLNNNQVFYYTSTSANGNCSNLTGWTAVTDQNQIKVGTLTFTIESSGTLINIRLAAEAVGLTVQDGSAVKRDSTTSVHIRNA